MTPKMNEAAQLLSVYIGEADKWRGRPLYAAIVEMLKAEGLAGATVMRGVEGFGAHSRIHTAAILSLSEDLPLVIQVVDTPEKIERALELVSPMVSEGLVTVAEVRVAHYSHRTLNPLPADRPDDGAQT
jgi:PII-like signaling protein